MCVLTFPRVLLFENWPRKSHQLLFSIKVYTQYSEFFFLFSSEWTYSLIMNYFQEVCVCYSKSVFLKRLYAQSHKQLFSKILCKPFKVFFLLSNRLRKSHNYLFFLSFSLSYVVCNITVIKKIFRGRLPTMRQLNRVKQRKMVTIEQLTCVSSTFSLH